MSDAGWTPVMRGEIYCSPRCGMGCKAEHHNLAQDRAAELSHQMGEGWEPRVWENFGWNWDVSNGGCCIRPNGRVGNPRENDEPHYTLMWSLPALEVPTGLMGVVPQIILRGNDPAELLGQAKQDARTFLARVSDEVSRIE